MTPVRKPLAYSFCPPTTGRRWQTDVRRLISMQILKRMPAESKFQEAVTRGPRSPRRALNQMHAARPRRLWVSKEREAGGF